MKLLKNILYSFIILLSTINVDGNDDNISVYSDVSFDNEQNVDEILVTNEITKYGIPEENVQKYFDERINSLNTKNNKKKLLLRYNAKKLKNKKKKKKNKIIKKKNVNEIVDSSFFREISNFNFKFYLFYHKLAANIVNPLYSIFQSYYNDDREFVFDDEFKQIQEEFYPDETKNDDEFDNEKENKRIKKINRRQFGSIVIDKDFANFGDIEKDRKSKKRINKDFYNSGHPHLLNFRMEWRKELFPLYKIIIQILTIIFVFLHYYLIFKLFKYFLNFFKKNVKGEYIK